MSISNEITRRVVTSDGLGLAVFEEGPADAPVVVFVHGYPDNHHVWDGVAAELAATHRVVRFDVRGAGASDVPADRSGYRIAQLVDDLGRVIDAVSPSAPVHLVAHDWGSIQCWDALPESSLGGRIASYTSVSGPSLDHAAMWLRRFGDAPLTRLRQLASSYYIGMFLAPRLPEVLARRGVVSTFVAMSASIGRPKVRPATADFERGPAETVNGINLYRANVVERARNPRPPVVRLPVQVVVASKDIHVVPKLAAEAPAPYVEDLTVTPIEGNHWVVAQKPSEVAGLVASFVGARA